jgi:hypothetical protein
MDPLNTRQAAVKRRCTAIGGEPGQAPSGVVNDQAMRPTPTTGRRRVVDKPEALVRVLIDIRSLAVYTMTTR